MAWRSYGNKYGNRKVTVNGETFDSKHEYLRFAELQSLERHGFISRLERQKKFVLIPAQYEPDSIGPKGGKIKGKLIEREVAYYADFYYFDEEKKEYVVEDAKSPATRTPEYKIKKKMMLYFHGIRIIEV